MDNIVLLTLVINFLDVFDVQLPQRTPLAPAQYERVIEVDDSYLWFQLTDKKLETIEKMLRQKSNSLNSVVIDKTLAALQCAKQHKTKYNPILTIIDFSLPSSEKRLWVFNLEKHQLLYHTYVSHGINSGALYSTKFSNRNNSKESSFGVFSTGKSYYGRHDLSLKLYGLESGFNSNAYNRFIVMHGAWYVKKDFVDKYGRPGRSWGCPAVPLKLVKPIINTIKGNSLMVAYYPDENWLTKSDYLNCDAIKTTSVMPKAIPEETFQAREPVLFADRNNNNQRERTDPVVVIKSEHYQKLFDKNPPLKRMLRRQINKQEYIALNNVEFEQLNQDKKSKISSSEIYFVIPVVKNKRGYWATEFKSVEFGKVKNLELITPNQSDDYLKIYKVQFDNNKSVTLRSTRHFIRWLGL